MKKKIIAICALALCAVVVLSSCTKIEVGNLYNADYLNASYEKDVVSVGTVPSLSGYSYESSVANNGVLRLFTKLDLTAQTRSYLIYNIATDTQVMTLTDAIDPLELAYTKLSIENQVIVKTTLKDGKLTYSYYTASGTPIVENVSQKATFPNGDMYVNHTVYRFDKSMETVVETFAHSELAGDIPACDAESEKYYYVFNKDSFGRLSDICSYTRNYEFCSIYKFPSYAEDATAHVFADGYIVVQYLDEVDDHTESYELIIDGKKYNLFTYRINPETGKSQSMSSDRIILNATPAADAESYLSVKSIDTIVMAIEIKDKRADQNNIMFYNMSSGLTGDEISGLKYKGEIATARFFGNGYLALAGAANQTWLLNAEGTEIGVVSGADAFTEKYILTEHAIYDYTLNKLTDLQGYDFVGKIGKNLMFEKTENGITTIYLYDGAFTAIGEESKVDPDLLQYDIYGVYTEVAEGTSFYTYYAADKSVLFTSYGEKAKFVAGYSSSFETDSYALIRCRGEAEVIYRVTY